MSLDCCPQCFSVDLITDYENDEVVCMKCGFVLDSFPDQGPEWRVFSQEDYEKKTRSGSPATYSIHDKGLLTIIDFRDKDIYGKNISINQKDQMRRLRKWQNRIRTIKPVDRNIASALNLMYKLVNKLSLPKNVLETASILYRKAVKQNLVRGRSIKGISSALVYIACRQANLNRTLREVSRVGNLPRKKLARYYRFLVNELKLFIPPTETEHYIKKISNILMLGGKTEELAIKILEHAKQINLTSGRSPRSIAAASCYIASVLTGERRSQSKVAKVAKVTEVTIRNRYKELWKCLKFHIKL